MKKSFKIATWNVNSLRVRLPHVLQWLTDNQPDILALQETKMPDVDFPIEAFQALGYQAAYTGQRTYNGVATISRQAMSDIVTEMPAYSDVARRLLCVTVNKICIINIYVPNGESVASEKYQYKLQWLQQLEDFLKTQSERMDHIVVLGDFNIAPSEQDVHDPKRWAGQVLFSDLERQAFQAMLAVGLKDCFRKHTPTEKQYSWWDYRLNAFQRNWGLRIDHILASHEMIKYCTECYIDKIPRTWERPSDHTPVVAVFDC